jgi:putative flippase GtrA
VEIGDMREFPRFLANGLVATLIHFSVLTVNVEALAFNSMGWANFVASVFGVSASFLGNRYFVFKARKRPIRAQAVSFLVIYLLIAAYHGAFLYLWSDVLVFDYRLGFAIAVTIQTLLSYFGNRQLVFAE